MSEQIFYTILNSPVGKIGIASSETGIISVKINTEGDAFVKSLEKEFGENLIKFQEKNKQAVYELTSYFKGKLKDFNCKLDIRGTPLQKKVWNNTIKIPYGKMRSYKFLAGSINQPKASRAVGNAMAKNPIPIFIPCHRVIKANGQLGNYGPGKDIKRRLLKLEKAI
jgi:methylated-DNA-[protein]-cysteine S-methyltransferase